VYGPPYCSAVRWASENAGVAEIVEAETGLAEVVRQLASEPARRVQIGREALRVGRKYFASDAVQAVFNRTIDRG